MEAIEQLFRRMGAKLLLLGLDESEKQELLAFTKQMAKQRKWKIVTVAKKVIKIIGLT